MLGLNTKDKCCKENDIYKYLKEYISNNKQ